MRAAALLLAAPAAAQEAEVARLFETVEAEAFAPAFRTAVPLAQVEALIAGLVADYGDLEGVSVTDGEGTIRLARALVPVSVSLDAEGRIAGLLLGLPEAMGDAAALLARIVEVAGDARVHSFATVGDAVVLDREGAQALPMGSVFKLQVLAAYEAAVAAGDVARTDVAQVTDAARSEPSGVLQTLPDGTPFTLESLAALMMRQSDNTATDLLIGALGLEVETTRDAFARVGATSGPGAWEGTWTLSPREACALLDRVAEAPALRSVPDPWVAGTGLANAAFKGGSLPGVLAVAVRGEGASGPVCLSVGVAGAGPLDEARLLLLMGALAQRLAG